MEEEYIDDNEVLDESYEDSTEKAQLDIPISQSQFVVITVGVSCILGLLFLIIAICCIVKKCRNKSKAQIQSGVLYIPLANSSKFVMLNMQHGGAKIV